MGVVGAECPEVGHLSGDATGLSGALPQPTGHSGFGLEQSAITRTGVYLFSGTR